MSPEGLHLDRHGLQLLMKLTKLDEQIAFLNTLGKKGEKKLQLFIVNRVLTRREAKNHLYAGWYIVAKVPINT